MKRELCEHEMCVCVYESFACFAQYNWFNLAKRTCQLPKAFQIGNRTVRAALEIYFQHNYSKGICVYGTVNESAQKWIRFDTLVIKKSVIYLIHILLFICAHKLLGLIIKQASYTFTY